MKDVEEILCFVERMTVQTEEDIAFQKRADPEDTWLKFLEGKLQAFHLVQGYVKDLHGRRGVLH